MNAGEEWLIDKSALARIHASPDAAAWTGRIQRGLVRITAPTLLEVGFSARSEDDWRTLIDRPPVALMPLESATPLIERRALEVQQLLAHRGAHRAPSVPDLLIAATAELVGLTILHVDKDFELIATVTGQSAERLRVE
ncbi:PIN domain nuclease [Arthrobacter castelli]|uniref:PIN domain nuclease n=1 Tax=Arthrobacter castelli TaxID=271431 RepID=UPI001B7F88D6|nr:PIN domain nuclease [Arthrobacter castelli]